MSVQSGRSLVRPGAALRSLRNERGWTLAEVSERTGLPASTLSKIENGKVDLTLDKLLRISVALEVDIASLFGPPGAEYSPTEANSRQSVTRRGEGRLIASPSGDYLYLAYELLNKRLIPMMGEVRARTMEEFGDFHRHPGEEFLYVLEGEVAVYTDLYVPRMLKAGDSMYFDSAMGHAYLAVGDGPCRILSIMATPETSLIEMLEGKSTNFAKLSDEIA